MPHHLEALLAQPTTTITPAVNQFEAHPLLPSAAAVAACRASGVAVTAYAPLAQAAPALLQASAVQGIAKRLGVTPATVVLRWGLQQGWALIPRSTNAGRLAENLRALDGAAALSEEDMAAVSALEVEEGGGRVCWDPNNVTH